MNFFEQPAAQGEPERPPMPPWVQPPQDELGAAVPDRFVLARTDTIVIAVGQIVAYTTGFELTVQIRSRDEGLRAPMTPGLAHRPGEPLPDDLFRFGVQYSDGRKGTSVAPPGAKMQQWAKAVREGRESELPTGPIVMQRGGGGGGRSYDWRFWIWPLPPPGPVTVACEWPAASIPLTLYELDARPFIDGVATIERLWLNP